MVSMVTTLTHHRGLIGAFTYTCYGTEMNFKATKIKFKSDSLLIRPMHLLFVFCRFVWLKVNHIHENDIPYRGVSYLLC